MLSTLPVLLIILSLPLAGFLMQPSSGIHQQAAGNVVWSTSFETESNLDPYAQFSGQCSGIITTELKHTGNRSAKLTIDTANEQSGCRLFRVNESRTGNPYYYSVWYYFPSVLDLRPSGGSGWHNIFQFKSRNATRNDAFWQLGIENDSKGTMYFGMFNWVNSKRYTQRIKTVPARQWTHLEVYYKQSANNTGHITVWHDGTQIYDVDGITTMFSDSSESASWSVNNYGDRLNPNPFTVFVDDMTVSTTRVGPRGTSPAPPSGSNPPPIPNTGFTKLPVSSVMASAHDGNVPRNTIDNNLSTRWSACGDGQWIKYDLGSLKPVSYVNIAFYLAPTQVAKFDIERSSDNTTWTKVFSGQSSPATTNLQKFDFPDGTARYVRIVGHGNLTTTDTCWNSYIEVEIYGSTISPPRTGVGTRPTATWTSEDAAAQASYMDAVAAYDAALHLAPGDISALIGKGLVLTRLADLQAGQSEDAAAQASYAGAHANHPLPGR